MAKITIVCDELSSYEQQRIVDFGARDGVEVTVDETLLHIHDVSVEMARRLEQDFSDSWDVVAVVSE